MTAGAVVARPHVYLLATCDTKGIEAAFVRDSLRALGVAVILVDTGSLGESTVLPDVSRDQVFAAAGTSATIVHDRGDRGFAVDQAALGAKNLILAAHQTGDVAGVLGLGGSAGTMIGTSAMRALPIGVPKVMVSTLASGQTRHYVGTKDIFMLNAIADISGINRISRKVLVAAAKAMAGLVLLENPEPSGGVAADRPIVALTMFGVTTPCVQYARAVIEAAGYETLVLHATGQGGMVLEALVREGQIVGVLDLTTTELADELVGGFLSAGPDRLTAAGAAGIPQVVSVGATDMVNFYGPASIPTQFAGRQFHRHNGEVTLMRTTPAECRLIGQDIGTKMAAARGPVAVFLPSRGVSALDAPGQGFDDPVAREALFEGVRATASGVEVVQLDAHINDAGFAEAAAQRLLKFLKQQGRNQS